MIRLSADFSDRLKIGRLTEDPHGIEETPPWKDILDLFMSAVQRVDDAQVRAEMLAHLLPELSDEQRIEALTRIFDAIRGCPDRATRARLWATLPPMEAVSSLCIEGDRDIQLAVIAKGVGHFLDVAHAVLRSIGSPPGRAQYRAVMDEIWEPVVAELATGIGTISEARTCVRALSSVIPYLRPEDRPKAAQNCLVNLRAIEEPDVRGRFLVRIAPYLERDALAAVLVDEGWTISETRGTEVLPEASAHNEADGMDVGEDAPHFTLELVRLLGLRDDLNEARQLTEPESRLTALRHATVRLWSYSVTAGFQAVQDIKDEDARSRARFQSLHISQKP